MTRAATAYDEDFYAWTQGQAAALRRMRAEIVPTGLDVAHLAEEIEDLGRRDLRDVTSNLSRLFEHLIKIASAPAAREIAHWHGEALGFQIAATDAFSASMRQVIDLGPLWRQGCRRAAATLDQMDAGLRAPEACPFALDEVLSETFEVGAALRRLASAE